MKKIIFAVLALLTIIAMPQLAHAQALGGGGSFASFLPIILIFVFFWFFLLRPQQKKAKEHQKLLNALKKDDKVVAAGGIFGTVVSVKDAGTVEIKIAEGVNIFVSKPSISAVFITPEEKALQSAEIIKK
ncbi:MAG: preprotein translocase subunit YajC [Elusimicrobiota bacterium]|jgi:preprotein translocase subunit YajC|nr:preprotein translocase subunit YajC [Elusimicrobiota bacterium]